MRDSFRPTRLQVRALSHIAILATWLLTANVVNANSGDSACLSLYPKSGAIQGTTSCRLTAASNTPVGLGSYSCTANLDLIAQRCNSPPDGTPEESCAVADPVFPATGATTRTETDFAGGEDTIGVPTHLSGTTSHS
jgi:hypothetical protein